MKCVNALSFVVQIENLLARTGGFHAVLAAGAVPQAEARAHGGPGPAGHDVSGAGPDVLGAVGRPEGHLVLIVGLAQPGIGALQ